jgi:uncharacterized protein YodC (DUF2158 family)
MPAIEWKKGDLVQLKSGGPVMTVQEALSRDSYRCQWFAGKKLETGIFPTESLHAATAAQSKPAE